MKFTGLLLFLLSPFIYRAQCTGNEPVIDLGEDTILCSGQTLTLSAPAGYDSYHWSSSNTTSFINVTGSGTYSVQATIFQANQNLVTNGDFEAGNSGFTSDYSYVSFVSPTALWDPGYYAIGNTPNDYHSNFYTCTDHTSGSGKMYIANGSSSPNTVIWSQTIAVAPNTNYSFTAWVSSVENTSVPAVLQFFVNGSQIGNVFSPSSTGCTWNQFYNLWNSGSSTSAVISIVNQNTEASGNDFALDDIAFIPYCTNSDTIQVSFENISVNAGTDVTICSDSTVTLTALSNIPNTSFSWNTSQSGATLSPQNSGTYTVTGTSPSGCTDSDNVNVTINPVPDATFSTSASEIQVPQTLVFEADNIPANANIAWTVNDSVQGTHTSPLSYTFSEAGSYLVDLLIVSAQGCSASHTMLIKALDETTLETANVFTPGQDGLNDIYMFHMENINSIDLQIFNRWGQEVSHITDVQQGWDGKDMNGKDASAGTYFYRYTATGGSEGKSYSGQGFIQLVR